MASHKSNDTIFHTAFHDKPDLLQGIRHLAAAAPAHSPTLIAIAQYVTSLKSPNQNGSVEPSAADIDGPAAKKRKIAGNESGRILPEISGSLVFSVPDVSFSIPVRKKLLLEGVNGGIRGIDAQGNIEVSIAWSTIEHVFCLPVPERAKPQFNFVVIPKQNSEAEPIIWSALDVNAKAPSPDQGPEAMTKHVDNQLTRFSKKVIQPSSDEFVSEPGTIKGSKSYGVRAHRGSKEGFLFFLGPGILWAFKKPLLFLPFHAITSVSYTSILQRTFNLVVNAQESEGDAETEIEFSMLDQSDFTGIDDYIKRHQLNDASMADKRRAKIYGVNAVKGEQPIENNGTGEGDEETELQRAERELQDAEDDEEEDYIDEDEDSEVSEEGEEEEEEDIQGEELEDDEDDEEEDG